MVSKLRKTSHLVANLLTTYLKDVSVMFLVILIIKKLMYYSIPSLEECKEL